MQIETKTQFKPSVFIENRQRNKVQKALIKVGDSPQRADPWTRTAPVTVSAVFTGSQVVGPPSVVGLVVQQPVAIYHIARVNVRHTEAVLDVGAIFVHLLHLAGHIWTLVQFYFVGATVLKRERNL